MSERLLDEFATRLLETRIAPAFAVAVTDRDRTLTVKTYGAASPESLWAIGSIGKSVTAVLALQLAEEGVIDLHAPVTDYVEWMTLLRRLRADHAASSADAHVRGDRQSQTALPRRRST